MKRQKKQAYLKQAAAQSLTAFAERSWRLYRRTPFEQAPVQSGADLVDAYDQARRLSTAFAAQVEACAVALAVGCRIRPGGVKDANRAIEKMSGRHKALPLDLLGGTLICASIERMYGAAEAAFQFFEVVSFRDRCIAPVELSGYRDLQLAVRFEGHIAELKIMHHTVAALDTYEHRIFEIQRRIEAAHRDELPFVEELVTKTLTNASRHMYTEAWTTALSFEAHPDR